MADSDSLVEMTSPLLLYVCVCFSGNTVIEIRVFSETGVGICPLLDVLPPCLEMIE